jgi:hypothetical protein
VTSIFIFIFKATLASNRKIKREALGGLSRKRIFFLEIGEHHGRPLVAMVIQYFR